MGGAWTNYVAKLRSAGLSTKHFKALGHVFEFATFRMRLLSWMRGGVTYRGVGVEHSRSG